MNDDSILNNLHDAINCYCSSNHKVFLPEESTNVEIHEQFGDHVSRFKHQCVSAASERSLAKEDVDLPAGFDELKVTEEPHSQVLNPPKNIHADALDNRRTSSLRKLSEVAHKKR